jgi:hypothetical protein
MKSRINSKYNLDYFKSFIYRIVSPRIREAKRTAT